MTVGCECSALSGRGLCVGLITSPEESYSHDCDHESSVMIRPWPTGGRGNLFFRSYILVIKSDGV